MEYCQCAEKMKRKLYTNICAGCGKDVVVESSPFDVATKKRLTRVGTLCGTEICLEQGVNFFVEALELAGAVVRFTCEGHPAGFSIVFDAPYELAFLVMQCGYFDISLMREKNRWSLSMEGNEAGIAIERGAFTVEDRDMILRAAAFAWQAAGL